MESPFFAAFELVKADGPLAQSSAPSIGRAQLSLGMQETGNSTMDLSLLDGIGGNCGRESEIHRANS